MVELSFAGKTLFCIYSLITSGILLLFIGVFFHVDVCKKFYEIYDKSAFATITLIFFCILELVLICGLVFNSPPAIVIGLLWQSVIAGLYVCFFIICGFAKIANFLVKVHKEIGKRKGV